MRRVIKNTQVTIVGLICLFYGNISSDAAVTAETPDLRFQSEAIFDDSSRTFTQSANYADLYTKLIIKNREIALLRAQIGYDLNEKASSSKTLGVSADFSSSERFSDPLFFKRLFNFDINLWTLVSSVLFFWLILRPHFRPYQAIKADQKTDYSSMIETGIGELDPSLGFESKLDLARALVDVGDTDGARKILEGVMISASSDHQKEAASMLDSLAN